MSTTDIVSSEMKAVIGKVIDRRVSFPIAASDIRRWAIAVYFPHPPPARFWDREVAALTKGGQILAPEEFNPFAWMTAEPHGPQRLDRTNPDLIEQQLGIDGPGLRFQLNGGIDVEYHEPMRVGDVITSERRLREYREREGRLGRMLFTVVEDTWTNQSGKVVKVSRQTGIRY